MKKIVYAGPDKYFNLKSDLITRNKVDAVSFEFTEIQKQWEEVYSHDLEVYGADNNGLVLNKELEPKRDLNGIEFTFSDAYDSELTYGDLLQNGEITDKRFCRTYNDIPYVAILFEPPNNIIYDACVEVAFAEVRKIDEGNPNKPKRFRKCCQCDEQHLRRVGRRKSTGLRKSMQSAPAQRKASVCLLSVSTKIQSASHKRLYRINQHFCNSRHLGHKQNEQLLHA